MFDKSKDTIEKEYPLDEMLYFNRFDNILEIDSSEEQEMIYWGEDEDLEHIIGLSDKTPEIDKSHKEFLEEFYNNETLMTSYDCDDYTDWLTDNPQVDKLVLSLENRIENNQISISEKIHKNEKPKDDPREIYNFKNEGRSKNGNGNGNGNGNYRILEEEADVVYRQPEKLRKQAVEDLKEGMELMKKGVIVKESTPVEKEPEKEKPVLEKNTTYDEFCESLPAEKIIHIKKRWNLPIDNSVSKLTEKTYSLLGLGLNHFFHGGEKIYIEESFFEADDSKLVRSVASFFPNTINVAYRTIKNYGEKKYSELFGDDTTD